METVIIAIAKMKIVTMTLATIKLVVLKKVIGKLVIIEIVIKIVIVIIKVTKTYTHKTTFIVHATMYVLGVISPPSLSHLTIRSSVFL